MLAFRESYHGRRDRLIGVIAGSLVALLGAAALAGWCLNSAALKSIIPGSSAMKPNIAMGMLLCGGALVLLSPKNVARAMRFFTATIALIIIAVATSTLIESVFGWQPGIDHWLLGCFGQGCGTIESERMSPATALCFLLSGTATLFGSRLIDLDLRRPIVAGLSAALALIGTLAVIGFVLETAFRAALELYGHECFGPERRDWFRFVGLRISGATAQ